MKEITNMIWTSEDADRFVNFALALPDLLNSNEFRLWEFIINTPYYWENSLIINQRCLMKEHLREDWHLLKSIIDDGQFTNPLKKLNLSA